MTRTIGIGDIHGCHNLLVNLVERIIRFNPDNDTLVFLGDYLDRGHRVRNVVHYLRQLKAQHPDNIVLLLGNHEDTAYNAMTFKQTQYSWGDPMGEWIRSGGQATIMSYGGLENCKRELLPFIEQLELYHEQDNNIFVHGGIPVGKTLRTSTPFELIWNRELSYQGDKTLVVGHSIQLFVVVDNGVVCCDTGAFFTGKLSGYDVLNQQVYQTIGKPWYQVVQYG